MVQQPLIDHLWASEQQTMYLLGEEVVYLQNEMSCHSSLFWHFQKLPKLGWLAAIELQVSPETDHVLKWSKGLPKKD